MFEYHLCRWHENVCHLIQWRFSFCEKKVNFFYENVRAISFEETVSWRMVIAIEIHFANEVKNVREIWCHLLRPQPGVLDGNSLVSRHHQIMFWAAFIFYLVNGQLSTTAVHEVRWVCVLTRGSCFLERFARPYSHRGLLHSFISPQTTTTTTD